jgi:hypothetical protein
MLSNALRDHVPAEQLPLAVETFRATVEGAFVNRAEKSLLFLKEILR